MSHAAPPGPPPPPPAGGATSSSGPGPRLPLHRRPVFWVALGGGVLALVVVGAVVVVLAVGGVLAVVGASSASPAAPAPTASPGEPPPSAAPPAAAEDADVFSLEVGECLTEAVPETEVEQVPVVDCAAPHVSEAYFAHALDGEQLPGEAELDAVIEEVCLPAFADFVGLPYEESVLYVSSLRPTAESWASGDRELLCLLDAPEGETLTGSARGTAR